MTHYDLIIVGGRPAGSTLAARLGQQGLRTLLLERSPLPSLPAASSPAIYAGTMKLLDEIGADENDYARDTPKIKRWVTEYREAWRTFNRVPTRLGRDYGYAIDRARFDAALWRNAARFPSVTARDNFAVRDLVRQGDKVGGVIGRRPDGPEETFTAEGVVGADGRFSLVARKTGAKVLDERTDLPTTLYYAYWKNADPYDNDGGHCIQLYSPGYGLGFLLMDSADEALAVVIEGQSSLLEPNGHSAESLYLTLLRGQPGLYRRVARAERLTDVRGMKRVGNFYREAGGPGWALVGDALHQKDPLDGQGIYDAVFTAKALSDAIGEWKAGRKSWAQAIADYDAAVRAETYPMYVETLNRVKRDLYTQYSERTMKTLIRWVADDPEYKRRLGLLLVRGIDPAQWLPASVVYRAFARGALNDLRQALAFETRSQK